MSGLDPGKPGDPSPAEQDASSQRTRLERLEHALRHTAGAGRVPLLGALAWELRRSAPARGRELAREALSLLPGDGPDQAAARTALAACQGTLGELEPAARNAHQVLAGLDGASAPSLCLAARCLHVLLDGSCRRGEEASAETLALLHPLLPRLEAATGLAAELAQIHNDLGRLGFAAGRLAEAHGHFVRGLALARGTTETTLVGLLQMNLGNVYSELGDYQRSLDAYRRNLELLRAAADSRGQVQALYNLGLVNHRLDDREAALSFFEQAVRTAEEAGLAEAQGLTEARLMLSDLHLEGGDLERARQLAGEVLADRAAAGDSLGQAQAECGLAAAASVAGEVAEAERRARRALELATTEFWRSNARIELAHAHLQGGEPERALEVLLAGQAAVDATGAAVQRARWHDLLGQAQAAAGDWTSAARTYQRVARIQHDTFRAESADRISALRVIHEVEQARHREEVLGAARDEAERQVRERTAQLEAANAQLRREIEERRQAEERRLALEDQLRQQAKMEAIGRLAAGICHDFNNILTVIRLCGEALLVEGAGAGISKHAGDVLAACDRAAELTSQLLAVARQRPTAPRSVDLDRLVGDLARLLRRLVGEEIEFRVEGGGAGPARVDPGQLEQAVFNLVVNAKQAMAGRGTLTIRTGRRRCPPGGELAGGDYACIAVQDSGQGIDPENLPRIFEPFFTTKPAGEGTGLGLSTVYGFARQSGGTVQVTSRLHEGTTFEILLPACQAEPEAVASALPAAPPTGDRRAILVVEDDPAVREAIAELLTGRGFTVSTAADGRQALDRIGELGRSGLDLVLSDVRMPGMHGTDLARELRQRWPDLPCILMSGYPGGTLTDVPGAAVTFLLKPFSISQLLARVSEVLDGAREGPPPDATRSGS